ncbi:branched-chain amino acid aminotransferase [Methyloceanibacter sp.]|uniref:branched-chain amino acid aminotransferase n=1 Tax=Methyloceanibacter sp. TaxID=1965321 RepID=UPI002D253737|nr:branched-chain amino acid aminotransferase [Methyloceanibacter sp.]HZP08207.1 branched-chain amino acid aminotransferase [Methyloceanibacter sp.]
MAIVPYDQRDGFIWLNGQLVPWSDARVHVLTHGLHYASAVFEGMRAYDGEIFKLTEHNQRLHESAKILDFEIPYSVAELDKAARDLLRANKLTGSDVHPYLRPIAWRGSEQMGVSAQMTKVNVAIAAWDWGSYFDPAARLKGLRLTFAQYRRPDPRTAPTKSKAAGLYMICTLEKHRAERAGYNDALMLDWRGQIAEATGANIFFVKDGVLHTPLPDCFLNGITRQTVIGLAKQRGLKVIERAIMPEELSEFSECFITGTAAEVTSVSEIGPYKFALGDITRTLMDDYTALVHPAKVRAAAAG